VVVHRAGVSGCRPGLRERAPPTRLVGVRCQRRECATSCLGLWQGRRRRQRSGRR
jgi:hypothetical protein